MEGSQAPFDWLNGSFFMAICIIFARLLLSIFFLRFLKPLKISDYTPTYRQAGISKKITQILLMVFICVIVS